MDDSILAQFQSTFLIGGKVTDPHTHHPHYSLYKSKKEGYGSQETRRKKFLDDQRSRRRDFADHARKLAEGEEVDVSDDSDAEMEEGDGVDEVDARATQRVRQYFLQCSTKAWQKNYVHVH